MTARLRRVARWVLTQPWDFQVGYLCGLVVGYRLPHWLAIVAVIALGGAFLADPLERGCRKLADLIDPRQRVEIETPTGLIRFDGALSPEQVARIQRLYPNAKVVRR